MKDPNELNDVIPERVWWFPTDNIPYKIKRLKVKLLGKMYFHNNRTDTHSFAWMSDEIIITRWTTKSHPIKVRYDLEFRSHYRRYCHVSFRSQEN